MPVCLGLGIRCFRWQRSTTDERWKETESESERRRTSSYSVCRRLESNRRRQSECGQPCSYRARFHSHSLPLRTAPAGQPSHLQFVVINSLRRRHVHVGDRWPGGKAGPEFLARFSHFLADRMRLDSKFSKWASSFSKVSRFFGSSKNIFHKLPRYNLALLLNIFHV